MIAGAPFESGTDFLVVLVHRRSGTRHQASFRGFKTEVDWFNVFSNDKTAAGVVSAGEEEIISERRHKKEAKPCATTWMYYLNGNEFIEPWLP